MRTASEVQKSASAAMSRQNENPSPIIYVYRVQGHPGPKSVTKLA